MSREHATDDHDGPALSPADQEHLAELEKTLQLIRDCVAGVVSGFQTGLFLSGPGGTGKSHTVVSELERLDAFYRVTNSRCTGRGLFDLLRKYPDAVHLLEDCETMLHDPNAVGVLKNALWG